MNQTYFIAWHPEYGYEPNSLRFDEEQVTAHLENESFPEHEVWTIKEVRIVEAGEIEALWKDIRDETWGDLVVKLQSILPEPTEKRLETLKELQQESEKLGMYKTVKKGK